MSETAVIKPLWDLVKISFGKIQEKTDTGIFLPEGIANNEILDVMFYGSGGWK